MHTSKNTLLQITRNGMGEGDEDLGIKLISNYFNLMLNDNRLPKIIVFYNGGVKLLAPDAPTFQTLKHISNKGVQLMACKTCLDFYSIDTTTIAGNAGTMMDIITLQANADKVITV